MRNELKLIQAYSIGLVSSVLFLTSCTSTLNGETIDYKSQGEKKTPSLAIPPDLTATSSEKRYAVSDGTATLSQYNSSTVKKKLDDKTNTVTPTQAGIRVERDGQRRWLVVSKNPSELYPKVRSFWEDTGFLLVTDSPVTGIMETDWAENRAKIPQDFVRRFLGSALDSIYSTGERDKFRTRFEKNAAGETEIYISHKGAEEKLYSKSASNIAETTLWTARPSDPELEAEMLARLMTYLGVGYDSAKSDIAKAVPATSTKKSRLTEEGDLSVLTVNQGFDKSWREIGLALDRSNFTVEDRDRSQGIYYVRFVNSKDVDPKKSSSWFTGWFSSSKEDDFKKAKKYRVIVKSDGTSTRVTALDENGLVVKGDTDQQILKVIDEQVSN